MRLDWGKERFEYVEEYSRLIPLARMDDLPRKIPQSVNLGPERSSESTTRPDNDISFVNESFSCDKILHIDPPDARNQLRE